MSRTEGRALWLPRVLADAGLRVEVVPGWERRGSTPKEWLAQIFHHTASGARSGPRPSLGICTYGRGGTHPVPGPLANAVVDRDGVWIVIAAGAANHAGVSAIDVGGRSITSGVKYWTLGWECENNGIGEPWPRHQLDSIEVGEAAVGAYLGWPAHSNVLGHKEIATPRGRKIDPTIDMDDHRRAVARRRTAQTIITPKEFRMDSEARAAFAAINRRLDDIEEGHGRALRQIRAWVRTVAELVAGKKSPAELAARAEELND